MSERELQQAVADLAKMCGWYFFHDADSRRSTPGWPDVALIRPPRFVLVELKAERGRLSVDQVGVLTMLSHCGQDVRVWRPSMLEAIAADLSRVNASERPADAVGAYP